MSSESHLLNKNETQILVFGYNRLQFTSSDVIPDEISNICLQYFMNTFVKLGIKKQLLRGIFEYGFKDPTVVQEASISNILMGNNIICCSANGTGKTCAYCIPILQLIDISKQYIQSIILVPTRELVLQTAQFIKQISNYLIGLNIICTTGGTSLRDDILRLKQTNIHLVVATPGRILDLAYNGYVVLSKCNLIIIDEAHKLLSQEFGPLIQKILNYISQKQLVSRQVLLYSSHTLSASIREFADKCTECNDVDQRTVYLNFMDNNLTLRGITQFYVYLLEKQKMNCLVSIITKLEINQCIIFCRSVNRVELLARKITKLGFSCFYIHSRMTRNDRRRIFDEFGEGKKKCRFLICTDLMMAGIHVKNVNVIINFDFPKDSQTYLYRIGRASRIDHLAISISFVTDDDQKSLYQIEHDLETEIQPVPEDIDIDKQLYCSSDKQ